MKVMQQTIFALSYNQNDFTVYNVQKPNAQPIKQSSMIHTEYSGTSYNGPSEKRTLPDSGQRTKSLGRTALHHAFLTLNSGHPEATPLKLHSCACAVRRYVRAQRE